MNVYLRAARDAVATVGAAYIPFSLLRLIAYPEFDIYFVGPVEQYLGLIAVALFAVLAVAYSAGERRGKGRGRFAGTVANSGSEKGNVLFLILIAVVLFGALSYAVTSSMRTGSSTTEKEQAKLSAAELDSYTAALNQGKMRLELINGCKSIDYTPPADQVPGDKSCHMFHPDGAGVAHRSFSETCPDDDLLGGLNSIGDRCGLIVYAGTSGGNRLYTTAADQGQFAWSPAFSLKRAKSPKRWQPNRLPYSLSPVCPSFGREGRSKALNMM